MKTRIRDIVDHFEHGVMSHFADKIGKKSGNVGDWLSGRAKPSAGARELILSKYPTISREWLEGLRGHDFRPQKRSWENGCRCCID